MISAVIHTFNEEKNIQRCLESLSFVDEIIVIDMHSSDKTCEEAQKYKTKIFKHNYTGYVEPARNFGISKAEGDWILILDADEEIPQTLAVFLRKSADLNTSDYFRIPRKNIIFHKWMKHAGWWPDYQVRFFKRGMVSWNDKIHGIPLTKGKGEDIEENEDFSIIHHNYQSIGQYLERMNRYTGVASKQLYEEGYKILKDDLFKKPLDEFVSRFFQRGGYLDGLHGLALSLLQSVSELVIYLKLWELEKYKEEKITLENIEYNFKEEYRIKQYWLNSTMLKSSKNLLQKTILKAKRKFYNK